MAKEQIPMCWKCHCKITETNKEYPGALVLVGCEGHKDIHSYDDAKKLCPLLKQMGK